MRIYLECLEGTVSEVLLLRAKPALRLWNSCLTIVNSGNLLRNMETERQIVV